jgi:ferredoxin
LAIAPLYQSMDDITIHITDRNGETHDLIFPTDIKLNLMEACIAAELPIISVCGGMALCGGCHAYIMSNHQVPEVSEQEEETLDKLPYVKSNSRLLCQIQLQSSIDGLRIELAPQQA